VAVGLVEEIGAEQEHIDRAYQRLEELRRGAGDLARELMAQGRGGSFSDRVERDARADYAVRRRAALAIGERSLCFGRTDSEAGETFHIGRLGVLDDDGEPLMVDWRTPVAEPFYRATPGERLGLLQRRHIRMKSRVVVGIDDEALVDPGPAQRQLVGEGALLAALSEARTGRMGDIVATIQAEQDHAIRSPLRGVLVVQGGPGTGKTAVALHRAAYLVYAHHFPLATQGILVVGPNPVFCRYIEEVLPGLGETGVRVATAGHLGSAQATVRDPVPVSVRKGSLQILEELATALESHQRPLPNEVAIGLDALRLVVTAEDTEVLVSAGRKAGLHNRGRARVEQALLRLLLRKAGQRIERARRSGLQMASFSSRRNDILQSLRRSSEVRALADALWPLLTPEQLVDEALVRSGLPGLRPDQLSEHDVALLDEADSLLGPTPAKPAARRRRALTPDETLERTLSAMGLFPDCPSCGAEMSLVGQQLACDACGRKIPARRLLSPEALQQIAEIAQRVDITRRPGSEDETLETFGHLIVDEAQDLTPMQLRMLARRCPSGSMTIVGDLGQAKYPWSSTWQELHEVLAPTRDLSVLELSVNYRTPREIMAVARPVLEAAHPGVVPPTSVRSSGEPVVTVRATSADHLASELARWAEKERLAVAPGKVAVLVAEDAELSDPASLDRDVVHLGISQAKGLEFDSVIVVEPAAFAPAELYVALTRSTRRLVLLHCAELPAMVSEGLVTDQPSD
jgi:DNA helicase IV